MADTRLTLHLPEDQDALDQVFEAMDRVAEDDDWPVAPAYQVRLALEELVLNVINYGFDGSEGRIDIDISSKPGAVTIGISDNGKAFDPTHDARKPDVHAPLDERPIGGLGVHLVHEMMDEFSYARKDGRNVVTIVKRL